MAVALQTTEASLRLPVGSIPEIQLESHSAATTGMMSQSGMRQYGTTPQVQQGVCF